MLTFLVTFYTQTNFLYVVHTYPPSDQTSFISTGPTSSDTSPSTTPSVVFFNSTDPCHGVRTLGS